jgi:hypothetical protein
MDGRLFAIFVVLNILVEFAVLIDGKDIAVARMLVEWIAIDAVGWLFGCQNKYRSGPGVGTLGSSWSRVSVGSHLWNLDLHTIMVHRV